MSHDEEFEERSDENGPSLFLILSIIVAALCAIFIVQNQDEAKIEFLFFDREFKVWVAIAISIALGVLLDRLFLMWWRRGRRRRDDQ